jgi:hypothetical protein
MAETLSKKGQHLNEGQMTSIDIKDGSSVVIYYPFSCFFYAMVLVLGSQNALFLKYGGILFKFFSLYEILSG